MASKRYLILIITVGLLLTPLLTFAQSSGQEFVDYDSFRWHDDFCYGNEICLVGDFDGGGWDDIAAFVRSEAGNDNDGNVWIALSNGSGFVDTKVWHDNFCFGQEVCAVGDFNGDGRDDIAAFVRSEAGNDNDGNVWVALSNGNGFGEAQVWHDDFCYGLEACLIGDFNNDGRDDIAAATGSVRSGDDPDDVWVALSTGNGFGNASVWGQVFGCHLRDGEYSCMTGDFNGDNYDDIVSIDWETDLTWVLSSNGAGFDNQILWANSRGYLGFGGYPFLCKFENQLCRVGDFNGNGYDDIFTFVRDSANTQERAGVDSDYVDEIHIMNNWGKPFEADPSLLTGFELDSIWAMDAFCAADQVCHVGDVNGDDKADIITFYRSVFAGDALEGDVFVAINRLQD